MDDIGKCYDEHVYDQHYCCRCVIMPSCITLIKEQKHLSHTIILYDATVAVLCWVRGAQAPKNLAQAPQIFSGYWLN